VEPIVDRDDAVFIMTMLGDIRNACNDIRDLLRSDEDEEEEDDEDS
jgi:hypothetical protein